MIGHPFNPPHLIPLVEVVPHPATTDQYTKRAIDFYRSVGKKPILIKKETPGFIANRLQAALYNEAYSLVARGIVSAEDLGEWSSTELSSIGTNSSLRYIYHSGPWSAMVDYRAVHDQCSCGRW